MLEEDSLVRKERSFLSDYLIILILKQFQAMWNSMEREEEKSGIVADVKWGYEYQSTVFFT